MKSKIETTTPQQQEIDWGKPMLVRAADGMTIITTGRHDGEMFSGMAIIGDSFEYDTCWTKALFQPLPLPQTITFYE